MTAFDAALTAADAAVDTIYAEAFAFAPMKAGAPDATRDAIAEVVAVFDGVAIVRREDGMTARITADPQLSVLAALIPQGVRRGDRFTRAATGKVYEVRGMRPDGAGRLMADLVELAS